MKSNEVDLHIHSIYSDGALLPEKILEIALNKGLKCISIADHNVLEGSKELIEIAKDKNIKCISGIELDTLYDERNFHILGYNFDFNSTDFQLFVKEIYNIKESINIKLIEKLQLEFPKIISLQEYLKYEYNREEGYWKVLHYLRHKGLINNLVDGKEYYTKYGTIESDKKLPTIKEECEQIHRAGGIAILAHPGKIIKNNFENEIENIINQGIDGIECYYSSHQEEIIEISLKLCKKYNLFITAGSDFHRINGSREIGKNNSMVGNLDLGTSIKSLKN